MAETKTGAQLVHDFISTNGIGYVFGCPDTTETTFFVAVAGSSATYVFGLIETTAVGIASGSSLAAALGADIWTAPCHVRGACDMLHPTFKGQLPDTTKEVREILSGYYTALLLGEKFDTFTYTGDQAVPPELTLIQVTPATSQLAFDWPVDMGVVVDIRITMDAVAAELGVEANAALAGDDRTPDRAAVAAIYSASGAHASNALILAVLEQLDAIRAHIVTEGSSEDGIVQDMAVQLGFGNVYFSPRGVGFGWAMPLAVGLTLGGAQAVCFFGDGGSMFSLSAIWSAAAAKLPVVFVVFVNHEYRLLNDLWLQFIDTDFATTKFVGHDYDDPALDLDSIMRGFGATTASGGRRRGCSHDDG